MKIKKKHKGIGVVAILLIITIVLSIGGIGYYVYNSKSDTTKPDIKIRDEDDGFGGAQPEKPVIYLYPEKETEVKVELEYNGRFISTYPEYDYSIKGWQVVAKPDGTLINKSDNKEYSYLFWDGVDNTEYDLSTGFVVKGEDTKVFLQNTLKRIGLTPKEYNEMIVYWLPKMEYNKYNLIFSIQLAQDHDFLILL